MITSAAAWLLIQDDKLDTDERVVDIIPEFGTNGKDVVRVEHNPSILIDGPNCRFFHPRLACPENSSALFVERFPSTWSADTGC